MKVSVIVPVYNGEKTIGRCLTSLVEQTLEDMEVIVVDNCSTDKTVDIVRQFPVRLICQEENRGQANSMNRGLDAATGEYVAECDADDFASPDMYEVLYDDSNNGYFDVVKCGFIRMAGSVAQHLPLGMRFRQFRPMGLERSERLKVLLQWPHIQSAIYRREFLLKNDLRYRDEGVYEDTCLQFKIITAAQSYCYDPQALYYYTMDNPNSGTATIKDTFAVCEQYEEIMRWNKKHHLELDAEIAVMRFATYRWNYFRLGDKEKQEFMIRAGEDFRSDKADRSFFTDSDWKIYTAMRGD